jgi:micrococcal nuclease
MDDGEAEVRARMFNAELLLQDCAQMMTVPPNVKYADLFAEVQREAREAGKGLWAAGAAPSSGSDASAPSAEYIGNANSKKFHRPDCEWSAKIAPGNRVYFTRGRRPSDRGTSHVKCADRRDVLEKR